ncbi:MAG: DNA-processing protein DprA, partial [Bacteroidota bacterium]|nr:DNA-processing protein DprA [Bacteroidota bacterium]
NGGLLTEFPSGSKIDPKNFVRRNRIIAGLADATIVIESGMKGGSLVTASLASSYNRDIFAFPGRCGDTYSSGCNKLIKNNQAALIESAKDLAFNLGWDEPAVEIKHVEPVLFQKLQPEEEKVFSLVRQKGEMQIEEISTLAQTPMSKVSAILFNLEMDGLLENLPGKIYRVRNV